MNIIKVGRTLSATKLFTCYRCGCEFEAEEDEYWVENEKTDKRTQNIYTCCPCCRKVVTITAMTEKPNGYLLQEQKLKDYMRKLEIPINKEYYRNLKDATQKGGTCDRR